MTKWKRGKIVSLTIAKGFANNLCSFYGSLCVQCFCSFSSLAENCKLYLFHDYWEIYGIYFRHMISVLIFFIVRKSFFYGFRFFIGNSEKQNTNNFFLNQDQMISYSISFNFLEWSISSYINYSQKTV